MQTNGLCCDVRVSCQSDHPFPFSPEATPGDQMPATCDTLLPGTPGLVSADLNQSCFCITIDQ